MDKKCNALLQIIILQILVTVIFGCQSAVTESASKPVEPQKEVDSENKTAAKKIEPKKEVDNGDESELNDILADFMEMNDKPYLHDTLLMIDKDSFIVSIKHLQIYEDTIVVPKKYVEMYKLESFSTFAFKTSVTIKKNGKVIMQRNILKDDFQQYLDPSLKSYAVLLYPYVVTRQGHIEIHHSISIPLTDVGIGVSTTIDKNGNVEFMRN
ncbi:hypothetical protein A3860_05795 [Niastella vici]|uniref:DUF4738 domain-containing protein n=1 Tax=Niastella vici TaxID=1703345 RepID=A0A1V9FS84_9BACT|nr:hypothetical protein [Niastella vici]OQP61224.1 hypothetical protein A3860_05795 [Niastella vici]